MTNLETSETPAQKIKRVAAELGLTMTATFVPWSQSRNKGEKQPSLNWQVTLIRNGVAVLTTDYSRGMGYCPSYKQRATITDDETARWECEHGYPGVSHHGNPYRRPGGKPLMPELRDVLYSLVLDADVIEHASFESWAGDFGYDADSRKVEAIYRACLDIALKLRNAIGDDGLRRLRDACQDY